MCWLSFGFSITFQIRVFVFQFYYFPVNFRLFINITEPRYYTPRIYIEKQIYLSYIAQRIFNIFIAWPKILLKIWNCVQAVQQCVLNSFSFCNNVVSDFYCVCWLFFFCCYTYTILVNRALGVLYALQHLCVWCNTERSDVNIGVLYTFCIGLCFTIIKLKNFVLLLLTIITCVKGAEVNNIGGLKFYIGCGAVVVKY